MKSNAFVNGYLEGYMSKQAAMTTASANRQVGVKENFGTGQAMAGGATNPHAPVSVSGAPDSGQVNQALAMKNQRQADAARAQRTPVTTSGPAELGPANTYGGGGARNPHSQTNIDIATKDDMAAAQAQRRQAQLAKLKQTAQTGIAGAEQARADTTANQGAKAALGQQRAAQRQREMESKRQALSQQIHGTPNI